MTASEPKACKAKIGWFLDEIKIWETNKKKEKTHEWIMNLPIVSEYHTKSFDT